MQAIFQSLKAIFLTNLGHCSKCMRSSFAAAAVACALTIVGFAVAGLSDIVVLFGAIALGLAGLWLAHLVAFALRIAAADVKAPMAKPVDACRGPAENLEPWRRRRLIAAFAKTFAFAALATALPLSAAFACVQIPSACTSNSDCSCSGCCAGRICQPSC